MTFPTRRAVLGLAFSTSLLAGCAPALLVPPERGGSDLGLVIERESGSIGVLDTSARTRLGTIDGLGDLSHASVVFARDGARAYIFGRDGALTKVNLRTGRIEGRVMQAGNSIGGAISQDGTLVVAQNYQPGGIKVFDARTLAPLADIPALVDGKASRVVGLADLPGQRFIFSLFDAGQIWIADLSQPTRPVLTKFEQIGKQPYDALVSPNGRHYIAGLFGEDGLAMIDLWAPQPRVQRILPGYGKGLDPAQLAGRVGFRPMSPDRLPMVGPLSASDGLWLINGFGARGLVWASLCAELLASQVAADPLPVETDLIQATGVSRFGDKRRSRGTM